MSEYELPPGALALFDQGLVDRKRQLASLTDTYAELHTSGERWEVLLVGFSAWFHDHIPAADMADLLAYAVHLIATTQGDHHG